MYFERVCKMKIQIIVLATFILLPLLLSLITFFTKAPLNLRLPMHIVPELYNISIKPFMSKDDGDLQYKFQGDVHIRIKPKIDTKLIVLHAVALNFTLLNYWPTDKVLSKKRLKNLRFDYKTERIIFDLRDILHANRTYNLHFQYTGLIHNTSFAVFYNKFRNENNEESWVIGTVFEPSAARHAFPCFDEPKFKANFVINIIRPTNLQAYSNTKRICSYVMGNYTRDIFALTPKMSTYLVAFAIGTLKERHSTAQNYGILAQPNFFNATFFALEVGQQILNFFGDYFDFDYYSMGIDKLHLLSMLSINFEGMENWGLVMVSNIVYEKSSNNFKRELDIAKLTAHEFAHLWFGNLVTCDWWNYIWLNEGFASYFMYEGMQAISNGSKFEVEILFLLQMFQSTLSSQAKNDASALNIGSDKVSRREIFLGVIYKKGATFVRMVKHILGEDDFQKSMQIYLKTFKYSTAKPQDLFKIWLKFIPAPAKHNFQKFCKTFTDQPGYPLIIIEITNNGQKLKIEQQRFLINAHERMENSPIFIVPITYTNNIEMNFMQTKPNFYLDRKQITLDLVKPKKPIKWLIANLQATGLYRVQYKGEQNWQQIGRALLRYNFSNIPTSNRLQLVDDIQNLFCAEYVGKATMLTFLKFLSHETHWAVWKRALQNFQRISKCFAGSRQNFEEFAVYMQNLLYNVYDILGFTNQTNEYGFTHGFRQQITELSCFYGLDNCIGDCGYYMQHADSFKQLSQKEQILVHCTLVRHGNETVYEEIFQLYLKSGNATQKASLAKALGCVKAKKLVERHFWRILNDMRKEEQRVAFNAFCSENNVNLFEIYKLIRENFERVSLILGGDVKVAEKIQHISSKFIHNYQKDDLEEFIKKITRSKDPNAGVLLEKALKSLKLSRFCCD